jgi:hypothetical protein
MRRPTRTPFHHSDLGGPFVAFAPEFRECDQELRHEADSSHPPFYPTSHQRWSVLSMLIRALRHRRLHPLSSSRPSEPPGRANARPTTGSAKR